MKKKFPLVALIFIIGIILAGTISYSAIFEAYRNKKIENEVSMLKQQAAQIENENNKIAQRIEYYQTSQFQEKIAKEKLNLQKSDENVVIIKPSIEKDIQSEKLSEILNVESFPEDPNYIKWWNFFFK